MKDQNSYPIQYIDPAILSDGTTVQLRPIHPIDREKAVSFKEKLSEDSLYNRFLGQMPKMTEALIKHLTDLDYSQDMAIVAEVQNDESKDVIAIARLAKTQENEAEFAIIVADEWQGKGLGKIMTDYMIAIAKDMGFAKISAWVFSHNLNMLDILKQNGFVVLKSEQGTEYAELLL